MMNQEPLVSIIMPTYNRAEWLPQSIGSVLAQDYQNWELIICDDGSVDDTGKVIKSFNDPRIQYYHTANYGQSHAMNTALQHASGELVAFLDDDDQWLPHKLSLQVKVLSQHPEVGIIFANFANADLVTQQVRDEFLAQQKTMAGLKVVDLGGSAHKIVGGFIECISERNFIAFDTLLMRKETVDLIGAFNEQLRNGKDYEYHWRAYFKGVVFAYLDEILMQRNKPAQSLSRPSVDTCLNLIKLYDACYKLAWDAGRDDLLPKFKKRYHRAWRNLLREYALEGQRVKAYKAFVRSTRYGLSWRGLYLLLGAIAGPKLIAAVQKKH